MPVHMLQQHLHLRHSQRRQQQQQALPWRVQTNGHTSLDELARPLPLQWGPTTVAKKYSKGGRAGARKSGRRNAAVNQLPSIAKISGVQPLFCSQC